MISDDRAFVLLKRRVYADRGMDCEQYKENYLKRRIAVRLRATGADGYLDYLNTLKKDPDEYTKLLNELTVNVTQFFRDGDVYGKLREVVMPAITEANEVLHSRTLRVWSAGCSSGEEPYSIAILANEVLGSEAPRWNVRVMGSDYDDKSLAIARAGAYRGLELPPEIDAERYFVIKENGGGLEYKVRDELRARVKFEKANLLEYGARRHFDLVLCRNVLIYFEREVQARIVETLVGSILGEGYLVLGKSETTGPAVSKVLRQVFPAERIYKVIPGERLSARGGRNG